MKIRLIHHRPAGYAFLLLVLIICGGSLIILSGSMRRSFTVANLNSANNQMLVLNNAAEGATEKVYALMARDFSAYGPGYVSNNLANYGTNFPNANDDAYWNNFVFSDAQGNSNHTYVAFLTNYTGPLPTQYTNAYATTSPIYRIISNVTQPGSSVTGTAQEDLMFALLPITTYAIFYNGELEFCQCAPMTVSGRVHSNSNICTGTTASLNFNGPVTCSDVIYSPGRAGLTWPFNQNTYYSNTVATNVIAQQLGFPMTNAHALIEYPPLPADGSLSGSSNTMANAQLANLAQVVLLITNDVVGGNNKVTLQFQTSKNGNVPRANPPDWSITNFNVGLSGSPTISSNLNYASNWLTLAESPISQYSITLPFLTLLTNRFWEPREQKVCNVTQIDVNQYRTWLMNNHVASSILSGNNYGTILYVLDQRHLANGMLNVVRLTNGARLPSNNGLGFTLATGNPLYVWGDYNTTQDGTHFANYVGATTNGYTVPAAFLCDAITILSSTWTDSTSSNSYTSRTSGANDIGANMTVNAAMVTGNVPSSGSGGTQFSGGVHNLTRLLENWSGDTLTYNTSIVVIYASQQASNQFVLPYSSTGGNGGSTGGYYNPPTRNWGFDVTYYSPNKQPPGVPDALVPIRYNWAIPSPGVVSTH